MLVVDDRIVRNSDTIDNVASFDGSDANTMPTGAPIVREHKVGRVIDSDAIVLIDDSAATFMCEVVELEEKCVARKTYVMVRSVEEEISKPSV